MRSIILSLLLGITVALLSVTPAQATSVAALSDAQLVEFSDVIAHVTILSAEPFRFDENTILTRITACDDETIVFYTRGGSLEDTTQVFPGEFRPAQGNEIVVFLEKIARYGDKLMVLGLEQGAFRIVPAPMSRADLKVPKMITRHAQVRDSAFDASPDLRALKSAIRHHLENAR